MAPAVTIDNTPDFDMPATTAPAKTASANQRTLLLAPPSVASHPEALTRVAQAYDRNATDIQMLDRLAMGLVALPTATYDVVLLLTDVNGAQQETSRLLDRQVMAKLVHSLKAGGRLRSQDGVFGSGRGAQPTEAILAGLVDGGGDGLLKPDHSSGAQTVTLSFGKRKANAAAVPLNGFEASHTAKRKSQDISTGTGMLAQANGNGAVSSTPAGVVLVDPNDDLNGGFDDGAGFEDDEEMEIPSNEELEKAAPIDPDTLLTEEDRLRPIIVRKSRSRMLGRIA